MKQDKPKKISPTDKSQALKRSSQYLEDFKKYLLEREKEGVHDVLWNDPLDHQLSKAGKKLCDKYKLFYPVDPNLPINEIDLKWVQPPVTWLDPPSQWYQYGGFQSKKSEDDGTQYEITQSYEITKAWDHLTHINDKLVIMIDVQNFTVDEITSSLKAFLKYRLSSERKRDAFVDIWEVYDLTEIDGLSYAEVTRKVFKHSKGLDNYHEGKAQYRQVERAHKKACTIIKTFENQR